MYNFNNCCILRRLGLAKILHVVPDESVKKLVREAIDEHHQYYSHIYPKRVYCDVELTIRKSVDFVEQGEFNADVIIARGLLATKLKKTHPSIPVVETPVTISDLMLSLQELKQINPEPSGIALIGLGMILHQAKVAGDLFDVEFEPIDYLLTPKSSNVIEELFEEALSRGYTSFMGGSSLVQLAKANGYPASFVNSSKDSIWLALTEAQHIAAIRRVERERAARFETILNHSLEGIIATNSYRRIIQMNSAAGEVLGLDPVKAIGARIEDLIPEPKFLAFLRKDRNCYNELIKLGKSRIVLNKVASSLGEETIGNVFTLQDVSNLQSTEIKIRSELNRRGLVAKYSFEDIIGESSQIKTTIERARMFALVPSNTLIVGETGTGKELFAQSMHNASPRKDAPFVAVNCAAIPENLMESEFFGYTGGAFTGASKEGKMGFFELAHEGTLFLDEVSEIPFKLQSKLLRVIQEGEVMRIGHDKIIPVKVRVICASNKNLKPLVREGQFREDLYYRLAVLQLQLPPLRNRGRDVGLLADYFIAQYSSLFSSRKKSLTDQAREALIGNCWEGNIRELRNVCEQLVVLNRSYSVGIDDVKSVMEPAMASSYCEEPGRDSVTIPGLRRTGELIRENEKELILQVLEEQGYNRTKASEILGINRSTLWRKMKEFGIECRTTLK